MLVVLVRSIVCGLVSVGGGVVSLSPGAAVAGCMPSRSVRSMVVTLVSVVGRKLFIF